MIEELLQKPYWVIDFLPQQVPADSAGQFFAVCEKRFCSMPLADTEVGMRINMGGTLPAAGFHAMKQEVYEIAHRMGS